MEIESEKQVRGQFHRGSIGLFEKMGEVPVGIAARPLGNVGRDRHGSAANLGYQSIALIGRERVDQTVDISVQSARLLPNNELLKAKRSPGRSYIGIHC